VATARGDLECAAALLEESESLVSGQTGERNRYVVSLASLSRRAQLAQVGGEQARASEVLAELLGLARERQDPWTIADALAGLGNLALAAADWEWATALYQESLALRRELRNKVGVEMSLEQLGWVAAEQNTRASRDGAERAARLLGGAEALREAFGLDRAHGVPGWAAKHEQALAAARAALGTDFAAAWGDGRALPLDEAVAYTLATGPRRPPTSARSSPELATIAMRPTPAMERGRKPLTRHERQVAPLIARGFSNRQIAAELVITAETAWSPCRTVWPGAPRGRPPSSRADPLT